MWSQDTIPTKIPNSSPCSVGGWRCGTPEGAEESRWYHKGRGLCDLPYRGAGWFSWILTYWMTFCRFCSTHAVCNCGQHYIYVSIFVLSIVFVWFVCMAFTCIYCTYIIDICISYIIYIIDICIYNCLCFFRYLYIYIWIDFYLCYINLLWRCVWPKFTLVSRSDEVAEKW